MFKDLNGDSDKTLYIAIRQGSYTKKLGLNLKSILTPSTLSELPAYLASE